MIKLKNPSKEFLEGLKVGDRVLYWEVRGGYLERMNNVIVHSIDDKIYLHHFGMTFEIPLEGCTENSWITSLG